MKDFIEMVNVRIENGDLLTIGIQYGDFHYLGLIEPDSIVVDSGIHIKTEMSTNITMPEGYECSYDEFEDEYIFKYKELTLYIS